MAAGNHSTVTEFILAGLIEKPELHFSLFLFFLGVYMITVVGNLGMIALIGLSSHLHTPMYYFLSSLSFIDFCYPTAITPKMLVSFVTENTISYPECMTLLYFFAFFIISECPMLAVMAYDRYVAICKPLLYNIIMSYQVCSWLVVEVYMMGLIGAAVHTARMLRVVFCKAKIINHYFCDVFPLLELSCSSTYVNEVVVLCFSLLNFLAPTLTILGSYVSLIASESTPLKAGLKPLALAFPTSWLLQFSMITAPNPLFISPPSQQEGSCEGEESAPSLEELYPQVTLIFTNISLARLSHIVKPICKGG
ncbi:putative olfactory receptor 8G2 [Loxodonta africana]|uniref:putative olfactory receptor 8G2 n=1 Tax=Loxodonta africana TaxID=9785 RepID=UPI0030D0C478